MKKFLAGICMLTLVSGGFLLFASGAEAQGRGGPRWGAQGQGPGPRGPNYENCPYYQSNQTGQRGQRLGPRWNQGGSWTCPRGVTTPGTQNTQPPQSGN